MTVDWILAFGTVAVMLAWIAADDIRRRRRWAERRQITRLAWRIHDAIAEEEFRARIRQEARL